MIEKIDVQSNRRGMIRFGIPNLMLLAVSLLSLSSVSRLSGDEPQPPEKVNQTEESSKVNNPQLRPAEAEEELQFWLENMAVWHRYSPTEISQVLGISDLEIKNLLAQYDLLVKDPKLLRPEDRIAIMPYPGGRHPRRGFLEGAINPQRETKFSVFVPWGEESYIVADIPEAIFSNLGLIYLAHTHIPTIWDQQGKTLVQQEWQREDNGVLTNRRELPNGIRFDVKVAPRQDCVRMEMSLFNGTSQTLTDLRVQHCLMLARAIGFDESSNENKRFYKDYALTHDISGRRWFITSWKPLGRAWGNPPVPCLHADPVLHDCPPGKTSNAHGWISFYEGTEWKSEIDRIDATRWWEKNLD